MIGSSFILADHANHTYDEYLAATDPAEIAELYDRTVRYDRLASAALLGGEVMVAVGLYARFLRPVGLVVASNGRGRPRAVRSPGVSERVP